MKRLAPAERSRGDVLSNEVREPAVAGTFYPEAPRELRAVVKRLLVRHGAVVSAVGVVSPHAGYQYSGTVAGATLSRVAIPERVVLLGPNHTGQGRPFGIMTRGAWRTPLGIVPIDTALAGAVRCHVDALEEDQGAHRHEHSIEVQVPFLQERQPALRIVPIVLASAPWEVYRRIGEGLAEAVRRSGTEVLLVASSDMTHYEPHESAKAKDAKVLEAIVTLDAEQMLQTVRSQRVSMCGYAPTAVMLVAARVLGATVGELVEYRTSGDATGDYDSVVGYAGVIVS